ncbi:hypothetical protein BLA50215_07485 [Burkholderia lata]|uniref:HNH endonuclease n=1 Tax=Burkholderia lata (strain ATCC 17760 / DSM 23089 / LMG 22485 / NCIMB 9086 / R18194 / 383) TaxID=482957 RepID=UPI0014544077|nr:HNH endonuclease signature motif containing protein [Burkholderia lata]VWD61889.1 hypothetical protein BLA50215_07485 [Burkholderia lata]
MAGENRFGLSRRVPPEVKLAVRQRCGFGCVICGLAFYDYEHFAPDFADAREHDPDGMTLLCPNCNQKRARGRLSAQTVAEANADPECLKQGFASEQFDFSSDPIEIKIASATFYDCKNLIVINDVPILSVAPPEAPGQPVRLSGFFSNDSGEIVMRIHNNEFMLNSENWDVECVGSMIKVRNGKGDIALVVEMNPPNGIAITRINMRFKGVRLQGDENKMEVSSAGGTWSRMHAMSMRGCVNGLVFSIGQSSANDPIYELSQ